MTTTLQTRTSGLKSTSRTAAATVAPTTPTRRRWGRIGAGLAAAVLGAWIFAALYLSAGDRIDVVVVTNNVERLRPIASSDLQVTKLSASSDIRTVAGARLDEFVGRVAAIDIAAGSPLNEAQLLDSGQPLIDDDEAVVGVLVDPSDAPHGSLSRGRQLIVVVRPPPTVDASSVQLNAWVWDVAGESSSTRDLAVEVVVPTDHAGEVSAAAADGRISIVALAR